MSSEENFIPVWARPFTLDDAKKVHMFYAKMILASEDKAHAEKMILDFQMATELLIRDFRTPLFDFMANHRGLLLERLGIFRQCEDGNYSKQPELLVPDLLNLVYCLAGYGPLYMHPKPYQTEGDF
jgi:hypothetical protein